jgi:transposase
VAKKLQQHVSDVMSDTRTPVELWSQDEARFGLKPILRKVWAPCGQRPRAPGQTRYEWLYVYGFVRPTTGQTYWLILPTVNTAAMNVALAEFARDIGAGPDKRILLVVDNAGWHGSKTLVVPAGIALVYLPPATPELQPAEHLWPLLREAVANQSFATLDPLEDTLVERCLQLAAQRDFVQHTTNFHWLPPA